MNLIRSISSGQNVSIVLKKYSFKVFFVVQQLKSARNYNFFSLVFSFTTKPIQQIPYAMFCVLMVSFQLSMVALVDFDVVFATNVFDLLQVELHV